MVISLIIFLGIGLNLIKATLVDSSKREIQSVLAFAVHNANVFVEKAERGDMPRQEAEIQVVKLLSNMQHEHAYVWANDSDAIARVHIRPEKIGVFQSSYLRHITALSDEDIIFREATNLKPFSNKKIFKINGITRLPDWNWVIGYGVYLDDINTLLWKYMKTYTLTVFLICTLIWAGCFYLLQNKKQ
jgi:Signal transduction histidine kinase